MTTQGTDSARAKELFLKAVELEDGARAAFLASVREEDGALADRVERLLRMHESARGLLAQEELGGDIGDYELLEEIASGGTGTVWRARQKSLGRIVAVKVLRAGEFGSDEEVARFRAEAEAIARLDDPNIVPVYEVGEHRGRHFFSMKLLEGRSLAERRSEFHEPEAAAALVIKVARAVHHAHQRGILHLDLKPSNILLDADGEPFVADFGIAKRLEGEDGLEATRIIGTPTYMAPEQTSRDAGELSVATDVWALGCLLYELLGGRKPFEQEALVELFRNVRESEPPKLLSIRPVLPRDLATIAHKCLSKAPDSRYPSANAVAEDLRRWVDHEPILASPTPLSERMILWWKRKPVVAPLTTLVAGLVLAIAVGATWATWRLDRALSRALDAESTAVEQYRNSLLAQAGAKRHTSRPGRRYESLELLAQAAAIRPGPDLRDEVIACLALTDIEPGREIPWDSDVDRGFALAPNGSEYAIGSSRGVVRIRELETGEVLRRLEGPPANSWTLSFDGAGERLAVRYHDMALSQDASYRVWDVAAERVLIGADEPTRALQLSRDGRLVAFASYREAAVVVREVDSGRERLHLRLEGTPTMVALDPAGERIAVSFWPEPDVEIRDATTGELLLVLPSASAYSLGWNADGSMLAAGGRDYIARAWKLDDPGRTILMTGHTAEVVRVFFHPTRDVLGTASWDGTSRFWDPVSGDEILRVHENLGGFSSDGSRVALSTEVAVQVARFRHGDVLERVHGHTGKAPHTVEPSADGRWVATTGPDGMLLWDMDRDLASFRAEDEQVGAAVFAGEDLLLVSGLHDLGAWDFDPRADPPLSGRRTLLDGRHWELCATPDGRFAAARGEERITVLSLRDDSRRVEITPPERATQVSLDPTASWLAVGTWRGKGAHVYDAVTGEHLVDVAPDQVSAQVRFAPQGRLLVVGLGSAYAFLRPGTWEPVGEVRRQLGVRLRGGPIGFSPDASLCGLITEKETVDVIDVETLEVAGRFEAPLTVPISDIVFGPRGDVIFTRTTAQLFHVWRVDRIRAELDRTGIEQALEWR